MPRGAIPHRYVHPYQLSPNFRTKKYFYENFKNGNQPFWFKTASGLPALPTANQGDTSHGQSQGNYWEMFETTAQTLFPTGSDSGLNISCDLVDNEALELVPGGNSATSRLAFTIDTDTGFFFKAKFKIHDVSGTDQFGIGFRKQEAFAVPTSLLTTGDGVYTDFFLLGINAEDGVDVQTMSDLNNGGSTTVTDTLFDATDDEVIVFEVRVLQGGKVFCLLNNVPLGQPVAKDGDGTAITSQSTAPTPAFTFDSGDIVIPWIFLRHDDEVADEMYLQEVEIGHMVDIGKDPNNE